MKNETKNKQSAHSERFDPDWDGVDEKFFENFFVLPGLGGFWFGYCWLGFQIEKKYALEPNLGYVVFIIVVFLLTWLCLDLLKWVYKKVFF